MKNFLCRRSKKMTPIKNLPPSFGRQDRGGKHTNDLEALSQRANHCAITAKSARNERETSEKSPRIKCEITAKLPRKIPLQLLTPGLFLSTKHIKANPWARLSFFNLTSSGLNDFEIALPQWYPSLALWSIMG